MQSACSHRRSPGFVLVATLWILAAIAIGAAFFAEQVSQSLESARQARDATHLAIEMENTRADVLFRIAIAGRNIYGIGETAANSIRLDNRPYRGSGADVVRIQDNRGLLNLNFVEKGLMIRLLGQLGVPAQRQDPMMDTLQDYIDTDNLRRLNGAEEREYSAADLPLPPNDWLTTPYQTKAIIGWRDQPELWDNHKFLQSVTTARVVGFDPNTAPAEVLASLAGSNKEIARIIIQYRAATPIADAAQLAALMGTGAVDGSNMLFYPSNSVRISQHGRKSTWMLQYSVTLTPVSEIAPWRVDYHVRAPSPPPIENEQELSPLPERSTRSAASFQAL